MILILAFMGGIAQASSFFTDHARGWHWYEPIEQDVPEEDNPSSPSPPARSSPDALVAAYRQELTRRLNQAWLNPTPEAVQDYQEMQQDLTARAARFSHAWMRNLFTHPHLDHTLLAPVNHQARHIYLDEEKKRVKDTIAALSQTYGLFFFFQGNCPYCHEFAPIVKQFAEDHQWSCLAISLDGETVPAFPEAVPDNGLALAWDVKTVPALFAVNPQTGHVIPVAYGLTSLEQMQTRIVTLIRPGEGVP